MRLLLFLFLIICSPSSFAEEDWFTTLYGGIGTDTNIEDVFLADIDFEDTYFVGLGLGKTLRAWENGLSLEAEGIVAKHFKLQNHFEFDGAALARWRPFPPRKFSVAGGVGLSYATQVPNLEQRRAEETNTFLTYLTAELAYSVTPTWETALRLHHRSGAYETFAGVRGASNFLALGIRKRF